MRESAPAQSQQDQSQASSSRKPVEERDSGGAAAVAPISTLQRFASGSPSTRGLEALQATATTSPIVAALRGQGALAAQRVPLGVYTGVDDARVELDTDDMATIRDYIAGNEAAGRQDLNRLLVDAVRKKDRDRLAEVRAHLADHETDATKVAVPSQIHMIWIGDSIGAGEVANIESVLESIRDKEGWGITLWTDRRKCGFVDGSETLQRLSRDEPRFTIDDSLGDQVDERVRPTYEIAYRKTETGEKGAFTMMSDLARYSILLSQGGIYMDVDLNLGDADVSTWNLEMSEETGIPAFGPNIQYVDDMESGLTVGLGELDMTGDLTSEPALRDDLQGGLRQAFRKMFETRQEVAGHEGLPDATRASASGIDPLASDDALSQKTRMAAMVQYMRGSLSNNLVAAPPNQRFLDFMIGLLKQACH
ncbi:MAG: glycosyltransferase [Pseudomonadota bacterium]